MTLGHDLALEARARQSLGESGSAIYAAAARALRERGARGSVVDVGCGTGRLTTWMQDVAT